MSAPTPSTLLRAYISSQETESSSSGGDQHVSYVILVERYRLPVDGNPLDSWEVRRRFNDFYVNFQTLKRDYQLLEDFEFPLKVPTLLSSVTATLASGGSGGNSRRAKLQNFLDAIVDLNPLPYEVSEFLGANGRSKRVMALSSALLGAPASSASERSRSLSKNSSGSNLHEMAREISSSYATAGCRQSSWNDTASQLDLSGLRLTDPQTRRLFLSSCVLTLLLCTASSLLNLSIWSAGMGWAFLFSPLRICRSFGALVYAVLAWTRFLVEILLLLGVLFAFAHRALGWMAAWYLRRVLGCSLANPQFDFHCQWIALRLGFDKNEVLIHNLVWRNPPRFSQTPCLLRVKEVCVSFNGMSVYTAIMKDSAIDIEEISFDSVDVFIEKESSASSGGSSGGSKEGVSVDSLNLWAAMGAVDTEQEKSVQLAIRKGLASVIESTVNTSQGVGKAVKNFNPAAILLQGAKTMNSKLSRLGGLRGGESGAEEELEDAVNRALAEQLLQGTLYSEESDPERLQDELELARHDVGALWALSLEESLNNPEKTPSSAGRDQSKEKEKAEKVKGFGFKYKLDIQRVILHSLKLHAQDYLNASHCDIDNASVIVLEVLTMNHEDLTKNPIQKGYARRPLYLDDFVWRVLNRLLSELIFANKFAMLTILSSAAANQTSSAVINAATSALSRTNAVFADTFDNVKNTSNAISGAFSKVRGSSKHLTIT